MVSEWIPFLKKVPARDALVCVYDTHAETVVDMTPATATFMASSDFSSNLRTLSDATHIAEAQVVADTGESSTLVEWRQISGSWCKQVCTKIYVGGGCVLCQSLDVTHLDPRSEWLARINTQSQRLELENGESISFPEFMVLNLLLRGLQHQNIADTLNISPKTVDYRISRLKVALEAATTQDMMWEVSSSGLVYLAMTPTDPEHPAQTELELYQMVNG